MKTPGAAPAGAMTLTWSIAELKLKHTFTITRGSRDTVPVVLVRLGGEGVTGLGEASPSARYGESVESVERFLRSVDPAVFSGGATPPDVAGRIDSVAPGNAAAKAALDIAYHDWTARRLGTPLWEYFNLTPRELPINSFTIGMDSADVIGRKVLEADAYPVLKVKLGGPNDREIIRNIRAHTEKPLRVDVNEGWKPGQEALETALWLEEQGVELIEQPFPAKETGAAARLKEKLGVPLIADESFQHIGDLERLRGCYDGVNIKLMKCGGPGEALRILKRARETGMKTMLGCMIESSVGIAAAAHLSPLADYADLDGNLLITNDPFRWDGNAGGRLRLDDSPGLGVFPAGVNP